MQQAQVYAGREGWAPCCPRLPLPAAAAMAHLGEAFNVTTRLLLLQDIILYLLLALNAMAATVRARLGGRLSLVGFQCFDGTNLKTFPLALSQLTQRPLSIIATVASSKVRLLDLIRPRRAFDGGLCSHELEGNGRG